MKKGEDSNPDGSIPSKNTGAVKGKKVRAKLDSTDIKDDTNTAGKMADNIQSSSSNTDHKSYTSKNGVELKSFNQLAEEGKNLPPLKKVWGNHILQGNTVLFPSERGSGKSFLSMQVAIKVAEGDKEFCGEETEEHGNTLYINIELSEYIMQMRLSKLYKNVTPKKGNKFKAYCITDRRNLNEIAEDIEEHIQKIKPVLVIIDNLRTAFSDSDNEKNKEMTKAITKLNKLRDKYGFALVLVHHTKKGSSTLQTNSDLQSGAGAISDLVDGDFFLRKSQQDPNLRILKRAKSRNCEEQDGAKLLRLDKESLWFKVEKEVVDESEHIYMPNSSGASKAEKIKTASRLHAEGKTFEEIGEEMGVNKSTISRWLNNAA